MDIVRLKQLFDYLPNFQDIQITVLEKQKIPCVVSSVDYLEDSGNGFEEYFDYEVAGFEPKKTADDSLFLAVYLYDKNYE
ncbi:MAG: hypothetical protein NC078_01740 [Ruminococcus sp.]|nr:hypothetical protein [Ruminococcus sp.]